MKIKVTDNTTGSVSTYDLSKNNWKGAWACMSGGLVHMWYPSGAMFPYVGLRFITSGRTLEVIE